MVKRLETMTWEAIRAAANRGALVVAPTASMEQHGTHLAVRTDTALVTAVVEGALTRLGDDVDVLLAPTLWLGASHHHLPFFALSLDESTYVEVITQLGESVAQAGFRRLFFINGHGGNSSPLKLAVNQIRRRCPALLPAAVDYWSLASAAIRETRQSPPGGIGHACEFETSLMMHVEPHHVTLGRERRSISGLPEAFRRDLVASGPIALGLEWGKITADGVLGDPTLASAEKGAAFYDAAVAGVAAAIQAFAALDIEGLLPQPGTPG